MVKGKGEVGSARGIPGWPAEQQSTVRTLVGRGHLCQPLFTCSIMARRQKLQMTAFVRLC